MGEINEQRIWRDVRMRIVPLLFILWLVNFLDRVNVSFASLDMMSDLKLDPATYGFGAGIFFIGYTLFEMPSNLLLRRYGARFWLTRIIVTWGIVSMLQAFVTDPISFVIIRFLLGVSEAGFLPGVLYYVTRWFPAEQRAQIIGQIMSANMIAVVVGAPISSAILSLHGAMGFAGWQLIFLLEGLPAVLLGFVTYAVLRDEPKDAHWLPQEERQWLQARMDADSRNAAEHGSENLGEAIRQPIIWLLGGLYFLVGVVFFGITMWLPQIVRQLYGNSTMMIGILSALPYLAGSVAMITNGRHSDRKRERRWHLALPLLFSATSLMIGAFLSGMGGYICVFLAVTAIGAVLSVFWAIPSSFLTGSAAAGGLALVNMISGISGFISPYVIGIVRGKSDDFTAVLIIMAICLALAALLAIILPYRQYAKEKP